MNIGNENILQVAVQKSQYYLDSIAGSYVYSHHKYESHSKVRFYKTYEHYFIFEEKHLRVDVKITEYDDSEMLIFIYIEKYNNQDLYEANILVSEYFRQYKKLDFRDNFILNNYMGNTLGEKLDHFFAWLLSVTDEKLIKIFKGEDWVDIPFDWGDLK